jgi:hypothetical protein
LDLTEWRAYFWRALTGFNFSLLGGEEEGLGV